MTAHTRRNAVRCTVEAAADGKTRILYDIGIVVFTVFDTRNLLDIVFSDFQIRNGRNLFAVVRKESASERFEEFINAVDDTAVSAGDTQTVAVCDNTESILTKVCGIDAGDLSKINTRLGFCRLLKLERCRGHAVKIVTKLLCRIQRGAVIVGQLLC